GLVHKSVVADRVSARSGGVGHEGCEALHAPEHGDARCREVPSRIAAPRSTGGTRQSRHQQRGRLKSVGKSSHHPTAVAITTFPLVTAQLACSIGLTCDAVLSTPRPPLDCRR